MSSHSDSSILNASEGLKLANEWARQAVKDIRTAHNNFLKDNPDAGDGDFAPYISVDAKEDDASVQSVAQFYFKMMVRKGQIALEPSPE